MTIIDVILKKYPGIQHITLFGDAYEGLVWEHPTIPKPTSEDIDAWKVEFKASLENDLITSKRLAAYNKRGATIDSLILALWKKEGGDSSEFLALEQVRAEVKLEFPRLLEVMIK